MLFDNDASDRATVIDVRAPDGIGLLYRVTRALALCGVDIRSAKVSTLGYEVVDAFYVADVGAGKVVGRRPPSDDRGRGLARGGDDLTSSA